MRLAGSKPVADDYCAVGDGRIVDAGVIENLNDLWTQLAAIKAGEQVIEGDETVGLAPAEVGLAVDDRLPTLSRDPLGALHQQLPETDREVRPFEEESRIGVLRRSLALPDQFKVCGELGDVEAAFGDVDVGMYDLAPRLEPLGGAIQHIQVGSVTLLRVRARTSFDRVRRGSAAPGPLRSRRPLPAA